MINVYFVLPYGSADGEATADSSLWVDESGPRVSSRHH